jgi:hypothetical protein
MGAKRMTKPKWSGPQFASYRRKYGPGTKTNMTDEEIKAWLTTHRQGGNRMSRVAKTKKRHGI